MFELFAFVAAAKTALKYSEHGNKEKLIYKQFLSKAMFIEAINLELSIS
jgi:hypothetical protein